MTIQEQLSTPNRSSKSSTTRLQRIGGAAAVLAATTFAYGIVMFATTMVDYTDPDATPAESVDFLVDHQGSLLAWYIGIFIVFGAALVPMGLALRQRLAGAAPLLANAAMVFAAIWAALMYATGMISNIGIESVADLAETDPDRAVTVWSTIDTVTNGLGGGNELVGGIWILLVSIAGLFTAATSSLAERHRHRHRRRRTDHRRPRLRSDRDGLRTRLDHLVHRHRRHPPAQRRDRRGDVMSTALTQATSFRPAGTTALRTAAIGGVGILLGFAGLQVALAAGAPLGEHVWGGTQDRVLPIGMRAVAGAAAIALTAAAATVARRAGLIGRPARWLSPATWAISGYLALNTVGNLASSSGVERWAFGPATAVAACLTAVVARRSGGMVGRRYPSVSA